MKPAGLPRADVASARRRLVRQLRRAIRDGLYYVPSETVAQSLLRRFGLRVARGRHQQR